MSKKSLLKDIAYEKIKEKILTEDDQYTSENSLVNQLEMSRTPIREALQRLMHEGYIKIMPNQGIAITDLSVKELNDITEYRIAIESTSLKQAVHLLNEDHYDNLQEIIERQKEAFNQNNVVRFIQSDVDFHLYLLEIVGNELFIQGFQHVSGRVFRLRRKMKSNPIQLLKRIEEHIRIIELLKDRNLDLALEELENHLKSWA